MNLDCLNCIFIFFIAISEYSYIIIDIIILPFSIWTTNTLKVLYCIYISYACIRFIINNIYLTILYAKNSNKINKILNLLFFYINIFFIIFIFLQMIIITVNYRKTKKYWKNCPYIINDLKYNLHLRRRCELYEININCRYSYQYICSYDSSKEFENKLSKEILPDKVICNPCKKLIDNNDIVKAFENEYRNEKKFYCSRTNMPKNYSFANHKDCNEKKKYMIAFLTLSYLRIIVIIIYILCLYLFRDNRNNIQNINNINYFNLFSTNISTLESIFPNKNMDFIRQKTKNIIIENSKEYIIETNIQSLNLKDQNNRKNDNILTMRENNNEIKSTNNIND